MSDHVYHCECLHDPSRGQRETETTKARPLRTSGPYLNATIKGRKLA